jgi:predicted transcriptional regulator of viral defense system
MPAQALTPARLRKSGLGAFFRPRDIEPLGVSFPELQRLVSEGTIEKVGPGLYRLAAAKPDELETIAMVASAIPTGIICLLSALRIHNIGTQAPHEVWLALDRKARKPSRPPIHWRALHSSSERITELQGAAHAMLRN